jgi:crotonobetainyl-CoA:carnitine CoA-transferase CaiB-like acyl-CoA transferase
MRDHAAEGAAPSPAPTGPLAGLVVTDLSTVLAGPYCTMLLADLGAEVVKVEPLEGDPTRLYGPPFAGAPRPGEAYPEGDPRADPAYRGEAAYYLSVNRNKRAIQLDLRVAEAVEVLRRLLARSDVLVENFRPGRLERLGFDEAALGALNPRLVHLAITGYGRTGPDSERPGFDFIIQAVSGLMSITGQPDGEGGGPTKVGVAITDVATGMLGAVAVLAALRARDDGPAAGRGQRVDVSLLGSTLAWLINQAANHLVGGVVPGRMGNRHPNITPYETFRTADGEIAVAVGSERQWARFCQALGLAGLTDDPRFRTNGERVAHREALAAILSPVFATRASEAWVTLLGEAEVPVGQVRDMAQVFADPTVRELGMLAEVEHPTIGELRLTGIPWDLGETPAGIRRHPPLLGEHTDEVLAELGFGPGEIEALRQARAV